MTYPQQPPAAPQAPAPAAPPQQAPVQQAPAQQGMQPGQVQQNFPPPQDQTGGSATDAAVGDPVAWQTAAEADARYEIVQRPMNGEVG